MSAVSAHYSSLLISLLNYKSDKNGNCFWKFDNSLAYDVVCVENMKKSLQNSIIQTSL